MKDGSKIEKAVVEFHETIQNVLKLRADADTPAAALAAKLADGKEAVQIAAVRLATARAADAAEQAASMRAEGRKAAAEAERLEAEAGHLERTAAGTVDGLYGPGAAELLNSRGKRCLKADEKRREAEAARGRADAMEADAKGTALVRPAPITSNRIIMADMTPAQLAGRLEDVLAALADGRLE